jgi:HAD superfamily 5'-nucleotidase-like hydrolase
MTSGSPLPLPDSNPAPEYRAAQSALPLGVPGEHRIFVNRNLRMRSIGAVGFDLDYTLAHYRTWEIDDLAYRLTQRKLVEKRGHPEEILEIPFDPEFVVRGLVIDRRRGNILKMDYHNYVVRSFHGRRPLSAEERKRIYRSRRIRTSAKAYVSVDTMFHLPEVYLYLALVDFHEKRGRPDYGALYADVRAMIDEAHADGSIKSEIQRDPERFVSPDPRLPEFLRRLREEGKRVFLLTNSELYYTDILLSHLLEGRGQPPWRSYFDLIVVESRKPGFFRERNPHGLEPVPDDSPVPVFRGGDVWAFEKEIGFAGDSILYWGDHTYGDILRSKKSVGWRTAMIIPELENEMRINDRLAPEWNRLTEAVAERHRLEVEEYMTRSEARRLEAVLEGTRDSADEIRRQIVRKISGLADRLEAIRQEKERCHRLVASIDERCNAAHNRYWGMLFRERNEITRFGHQVKDFACLYTSRVSNLLHYPMNTYFRAPVERLPHEL